MDNDGLERIGIGANIYRIACVRHNVGDGKILGAREHTHIGSGAVFYRVLQTVFMPFELSARIECQTAGAQFQIRLFERSGDGEVCTNLAIGESVHKINERSVRNE